MPRTTTISVTQYFLVIIFIFICLGLSYIIYFHSHTLAHTLAHSYYQIETIDSIKLKGNTAVQNCDIWRQNLDEEIRHQMQRTKKKFEWKSETKLTSSSNQSKDAGYNINNVNETPQMKWKVFISLTEDPYEESVTWIQTNGSMFDRLQQFNKALNDFRYAFLAHRTNMIWNDVNKHINVVWGNSDDFLSALSNFKNVKTIGLSWKGNHITDNLLVQKYYSWTSSELLCKWINTPGETLKKRANGYGGVGVSWPTG